MFWIMSYCNEEFPVFCKWLGIELGGQILGVGVGKYV